MFLLRDVCVSAILYFLVFLNGISNERQTNRPPDDHLLGTIDKIAYQVKREKKKNAFDDGARDNNAFNLSKYLIIFIQQTQNYVQAGAMHSLFVAAIFFSLRFLTLNLFLFRIFLLSDNSFLSDHFLSRILNYFW